MENAKTCGICLELILTNNFEKLDFAKRRYLKCLVNLDITATEEVIICSKCANICREVYVFKNACLKNNDHLHTLIHPNADCKLILEDVIIRKIKDEVNCEDEKVCQFCLNYFEATSLIVIKMEQNVTITDMLEKCLPELDMSIVHDSLICFVCMDLLKKCFNFICNCEVSELIRDLTKDSGDFIDQETLITKIEIVDDCLDYNFVKVEGDIEETIETKHQIKIEEEDIDMDENCKGLLNEAPKESNSHLKDTTMSDKVEDRKYACTLCPYRTKHKQSLKNHYQVHQEPSETVGFKCDKCLYVTNIKASLKSHYLCHKKPSELTMIKCEKCPFEAKCKNSLVNHQLIHKNPSEIPIYKCAECTYETRHKYYFLKHKENHLKTHGSNGDAEVFICYDCNFVTNTKRNLKRHIQYHQEVKAQQFLRRQNLSNSEEAADAETNLFCSNYIKIFPCDICMYTARQKEKLKEHYIIHKDLTEIEHFKCNQCSYVTKRKTSLRKHQAVHIDISKRHRYSCTECIYEALTRSSLTRHRKNIHGRGKTHEKTYICYECSHETTNRKNFVYHLGIHRQGKIPNKKRRPLSGRDKLYKCNQCDYETKYKRSFSLHLITHKDFSETTIHK